MKRLRKVKFPICLRKRIGTRKAKRRVTTVVVRLAGVDLGVSRGPVGRVDVVHPREARTNASLLRSMSTGHPPVNSSPKDQSLTRLKSSLKKPPISKKKRAKSGEA